MHMPLIIAVLAFLAFARLPVLDRAGRKAARNGSSSYGSGERQMYPAVCAQCGRNTQVPFSPRGDRPVYCSDCYRAQQGSSRY